MKYFDVKLKDFQVAAIAALIALGCLLASPKNTAEAAGISMAAPALHDLARSAPDATVEKAYYHYYRRHYGIRIGTVAIIGIVGIIGAGLTTGITTITRTGVTTGTPTATIGEQPAQFVALRQYHKKNGLAGISVSPFVLKNHPFTSDTISGFMILKRAMIPDLTGGIGCGIAGSDRPALC